MTTISGTNNWRLTVRRDGTSVTILRAVTCDACAALPDELFGLPVVELSDHALAPSATAVAGEEIQITCGVPQGEWDNRDLRELTLPRQLASVGDYAFFSCRALQALHLHDGVTHWGGGVLMNCRSLDRILLTRVESAQGESLAYFADELSRELDVSIFGADGDEIRLIFPEYIEDFEENGPAHHFDYAIYGAGHPYHHVFRGKTLYLTDYDALWERFFSAAHEKSTALRLAWYRLRYPRELAVWARAQYEDYLRAHADEALRFLLEQRDIAGLRQLLDLLDGVQFGAALAFAREQCMTEATAILLERQHRRDGGREKDFDL